MILNKNIVVAGRSETWQVSCGFKPITPRSEKTGQGFPKKPLRNLSPSMRKTPRDIIKKNLGRRVRELRLSLKMSQAVLADEAKIRRALISEIEQGKANPTLDSIVSIAVALGVDLAKLLDSP